MVLRSVSVSASDSPLPALEKIWDKVPYASRKSSGIDEHLDAVLAALEKSRPHLTGLFWPDFSKTLTGHPFRTKMVYFRDASGTLQSRTVAEVLRDVVEGKR